MILRQAIHLSKVISGRSTYLSASTFTRSDYDLRAASYINISLANRSLGAIYIILILKFFELTTVFYCFFFMDKVRNENDIDTICFFFVIDSWFSLSLPQFPIFPLSTSKFSRLLAISPMFIVSPYLICKQIWSLASYRFSAFPIFGLFLKQRPPHAHRPACCMPSFRLRSF